MKIDFDATKVDTSRSGLLLPKHDCTIEIIKSEPQATKSGGKSIVFHCQIQDGQYQGRVVFERLNLKNASATAQKISFETLARICKACGFERIGDTEELHNIPLAATIDIDGEYNRVKIHGPGKKIEPVVNGTTTTTHTESAINEDLPW